MPRGRGFCTGIQPSLFIIMAITGLSLLLGRIFLIPVFGHWADSGLSSGVQGAPQLLRALCFLSEFFWSSFSGCATTSRRKWTSTGLRTWAAMFGGGPRPHIGKVNARREGMVLAYCHLRDRRGYNRRYPRFPDLGADALHHAGLSRNSCHRGRPVCHRVVRSYLHGNHRRRGRLRGHVDRFRRYGMGQGALTTCGMKKRCSEKGADKRRPDHDPGIRTSCCSNPYCSSPPSYCWFMAFTRENGETNCSRKSDGRRRS